MLISGVQQFTMLDYPEKTACIIWTAGCNFRCGYCHNPEFVLPEKVRELSDTFISEEAILSFLKSRIGKLDGVVISGGEPTMHLDLPEFITKIKKLGFLVKLDTNGNNPFMVRTLIDEKLIDYVAMDMKTDLENYEELVGCRAKPAFIKLTIEMLLSGEIPYEFRSTLIREVHTESTLQEMASLIDGARVVYLQQFRPDHTLDPAYASMHPFSKEQMEQIRSIFTPHVRSVHIRS